MAKSLRASNKVKARNARRYTPNTDYAIIHAARLEAIAKRLAQRTKGPTVFEEEEKEEKERGKIAKSGEETEGNVKVFEMEAEGEENGKQKVQAMEIVEETTTPKISTSGPRGARREEWRKSKGWAPRRGSKNAGKSKRRR